MRGGYQPKSSISNNISEQEKLEAETALRSLKMKMANKGKKPLRQTNTANQVRKSPNYNHSNLKGNNTMNQRQLYNNMYQNNNMNYNNIPSMTEMGNNQYGGVRANMNRKPITAIEYNRNHNYNNDNYNMNNMNNMNNNYNKNRSYKPNQYNSGNNYKNSNPRRNNNNYNNYNSKINYQNNDNDERPIGGGLTEDQMPEEESPTSPCPHCGRNFNPNALSKHVKICEKVFMKKRKAFNTQKQRINDSEQASLMKQGAMEAKRNPLLNKKNNGAIPKWKLQSMAFRAICNPGKNPAPNQMMMNNNRMGMNNKTMGKNNNRMGMNKNMNNMNYADNGYGMGGGGFVSNAMAYDYKHCEFCNRNYNEEAYNKHLNFCKRRYENEKIKNKGKKPNTNNNIKKSQYTSSLSGGVKYNSGKYKKK